MEKSRVQKDNIVDIDEMYNQGRKEGDSKWLDAIDKRIDELEEQTGIKELKRLRDKTRYRW
jgi:hypothetical protein